MDTSENRKIAAMEEHTAAERESDDGSNSTANDRISHLPQAVLNQILYFLSQEEAAQTCVLSKAWRHVWSTRPNIQFNEWRFKGDKQTFLSVLDRTLQGYHDQKLCIQEFDVSMSVADAQSAVPFLDKWMPIVLLNMGVKEFSLDLDSKSNWAYDISWVLFQAESLQYLSLDECNLNKMAPDKQVLFKHLKTLYLSEVHIEEETFQKIISSCPLIQDIYLYRCKGLRTVKVMTNDDQKLHNLKYFAFTSYKSYTSFTEDSIEINVPTLETVRIVGSWNWELHDHHMFPNLKSLDLETVRLSSKLLDKFSSNFPILEKLTIFGCYGLEEFKLSSHSIKYFSLMHLDKPIKLTGTIDAPHIHTFQFNGCLPPSISFTTTYSEWNSKISLDFSVDSVDDASSWFHNLNEMLKGLSQSEISLDISLYISQHGNIDAPLVLLDVNGGGVSGFNKPLVVEKLSLRSISDSSSSVDAFLNWLFGICHPRNMYWNSINPGAWGREHKELTEHLCKIFLSCGNNYQEFKHHQYDWQQDLEEVSMEVYDEDGEEWHPAAVYGTGFSECAFPENEDIHFLLKWRADIA